MAQSGTGYHELKSGACRWRVVLAILEPGLSLSPVLMNDRFDGITSPDIERYDTWIVGWTRTIRCGYSGSIGMSEWVWDGLIYCAASTI